MVRNTGRGLKAGVTGAIIPSVVFSVWAIIYYWISPPPWLPFPSLSLVVGIILSSLIFGVFWGVIIGLIYATVSNRIPIQSSIGRGLVLAMIPWVGLLVFIKLTAFGTLLWPEWPFATSFLFFASEGALIGFFWEILPGSS